MLSPLIFRQIFTYLANMLRVHFTKLTLFLLVRLVIKGDYQQMNSEPGLNLTTFLAGMSMGSFVFGLIPFLALFSTI